MDPNFRFPTARLGAQELKDNYLSIASHRESVVSSLNMKSDLKVYKDFDQIGSY